MDKIFGTTAAIDEARLTSKRRNFFTISFMFILVYFLGSMISGALMTVPMQFYIFTSDEILLLMESGVTDTDVLMEAVYEFMPEWMNAVSLITTAGMIIAALVYCTRFERRRACSLGFFKKGAVPEYLSGLLIGLLMFAAAYGIILLSGQAEFAGFNSDVSIPLILLFFVGFLIQGMSEEVLLRGFYFVSGSYTSSVWISVFASSATFALLHLANNGITAMSIINLFLFGVFAALYFLRRGNIWGISAIHSVWNFAQGNIFGCRVSGSLSGESLFATKNLGDSALFNGGSFGPEGGLGVTIVLLVAIIILLPMKNKRVEVPPIKLKGEFYSAL